MNEIVRLLRKVLRHYNYDVRRSEAYNILPLKNSAATSALLTIRDALSQDAETDKLKAFQSTNSLKIIVRTCLREDRNLKKVNRVSETSLIETIKRCLNSLVKSANHALQQPEMTSLELLILDDSSEPRYLEEIKTVMQALKCPWKLQQTKEKGQGKSLHEQFSIAKNDNALYYFCEDDYLHEESAIFEMWLFYNQIYQMTAQHMLLHPQESESLYSNFYPSYLLLSPYRHWRSMSHATHAFLTHSEVVKQYWKYFENTKYVGDPKKRHLGSESKTTNRIFEHLPGFCPVAPLAAHLQSEKTLPPLFDWKALWERNAVTS